LYLQFADIFRSDIIHCGWVRTSTRPPTGINIPQKTAVIAMGAISIFVLIYLLSNIFWWTLFSSGFLIAIHAFLRDASMHKDLDDAMAMEGDLNFSEETSFLDNNV